ncbi:MAG: hypothetical protein LC789_00625 [Actinobacteria bacterium]|nr:hypothetical protein [Actinomycetota bacterium]MCA1719750.1 hypothetical protein [Actinomycetota bacterium]
MPAILPASAEVVVARVGVVPLRPHRGFVVPLTMMLTVGLGRPVCLYVQALLRWWRWGRTPPPGGWRTLFPPTLAELVPARLRSRR